MYLPHRLATHAFGFGYKKSKEVKKRRRESGKER